MTTIQRASPSQGASNHVKDAGPQVPESIYKVDEVARKSTETREDLKKDWKSYTIEKIEDIGLFFGTKIGSVLLFVAAIFLYFVPGRCDPYYQEMGGNCLKLSGKALLWPITSLDIPEE